jgi:hypothetical protein
MAVAVSLEPDRAGSYLTSGRQAVEKVDVMLPMVLDSDRLRSLALVVNGHEDRELFMGVASDLCWHGGSPIRRKLRFHRFTSERML